MKAREGENMWCEHGRWKEEVVDGVERGGVGWKMG